MISYQLQIDPNGSTYIMKHFNKKYTIVTIVNETDSHYVVNDNRAIFYLPKEKVIQNGVKI